MIEIWRLPNRRCHYSSGASPDRSRRFWSYLLLGLAHVALVPGCAWVRAQAQHRSEQCGELCSKAQAARQAGRSDHADALLDAALKKSPKDYETQRQLADELWDSGRQQESLTILGRLSDECPQDVQLAVGLAERMAELGRSQEALRRLHPALAADPTSISAWELKAKIETDLGDYDAALASYQRLCHQKSVSVSSLQRMGELYLRRGQPERAAPLFRMALVDPHASAHNQAEAQWQLGKAYFQAERWSEAADQLAEAATQREMNADDWHSVASVQYRAGDVFTARNSVNRALNLQPNHAPSRELAAAMQHGQPPTTAGIAPELSPVGFQNVEVTRPFLP